MNHFNESIFFDLDSTLVIKQVVVVFVRMHN